LLITSAIGFGDLSAELQQELQELQKRMAVELKPLVLESSLTMQKILEADSHKEDSAGGIFIKRNFEDHTRGLKCNST
jgi:hypothetical protein